MTNQRVAPSGCRNSPPIENSTPNTHALAGNGRAGASNDGLELQLDGTTGRRPPAPSAPLR
eukprot:5023196-Lingulodinium_polyedra.AAC.1